MNNAEHYQPTAAQRLQQLNVIKRFLQAERPLMLIVGEKDSGKTKLLTDITLQMRISRHVVRLQATPNLNPSQLIAAIAKHWEIRHADQHERIEKQLDEMLGELIDNKRACILIIDDAHLLSLSVLAALSHLVTQQAGKRVYLHILLTGRPMLTEKINSLQTEDVPRLTVGALTREEAFRKIKRLLDNSGLNLPHTAANVIFTKLYRRSEGMPQTLENMVKELIVHRASIDPPVIEKPQTPKPVAATAPNNRWKAHRIKTVSLLMLVVFGYLFWGWQQHLRHSQSTVHYVVSEPTTPRPVYKKIPALAPTPTPMPAPTLKPIPKPAYTLQLMSGMNTKAMTHYIQQHHIDHQAHIMKTQYKGHDWYVLTYGAYPHPKVAKAAINTLPIDLKSRHPWVRPTQQLLPIGGPSPH